MNNNNYHKTRNKCWSNMARKGGKKCRYAKGYLRRKWYNWLDKQEYKEERRFDEKVVDNGEKS